ncbi:hypothetical protein BDW22DRAFT_1349106 [Trametopsis cervina]|nr:hypothetical protein BDW22DRAFT_1349106 [Trametopsis cervina]
MASSVVYVPDLSSYWEESFPQYPGYQAHQRKLAAACFYAWTFTPSPNDNDTFQVCRTERTKVGVADSEPQPVVTIPKTYIELARQLYGNWNSYAHAYAVDASWSISLAGTNAELKAFKSAIIYMEGMLMIFSKLHVAIVRYHTDPPHSNLSSPFLAWGAYNMLQMSFESRLDEELLPRWLYTLFTHPNLQSFDWNAWAEGDPSRQMYLGVHGHSSQTILDLSPTVCNGYIGYDQPQAHFGSFVYNVFLPYEQNASDNPNAHTGYYDNPFDSVENFIQRLEHVHRRPRSVRHSFVRRLSQATVETIFETLLDGLQPPYVRTLIDPDDILRRALA